MLTFTGDIEPGTGFRPGARLTIRVPAAASDAFGLEPFTTGQGFTLQFGDAVWRGVLIAATTAEDWTDLDIRVEDTTPAGYGAAVRSGS